MLPITQPQTTCDQTVEVNVLSQQRSRSDASVRCKSYTSPLCLDLLRSSSSLSLFLIVLVVKVADCLFSNGVVSPLPP